MWGIGRARQVPSYCAYCNTPLRSSGPSFRNEFMEYHPAPMYEMGRGARWEPNARTYCSPMCSATDFCNLLTLFERGDIVAPSEKSHIIGMLNMIHLYLTTPQHIQRIEQELQNTPPTQRQIMLSACLTPQAVHEIVSLIPDKDALHLVIAQLFARELEASPVLFQSYRSTAPLSSRPFQNKICEILGIERIAASNRIHELLSPQVVADVFGAASLVRYETFWNAKISALSSEFFRDRPAFAVFRLLRESEELSSPERALALLAREGWKGVFFEGFREVLTGLIELDREKCLAGYRKTKMDHTIEPSLFKKVLSKLEEEINKIGELKGTEAVSMTQIIDQRGASISHVVDQSRKVTIQDSVVTRSPFGTGTESKNIQFCPYCGKELDFPKPPRFCPYCREQLSAP